MVTIVHRPLPRLCDVGEIVGDHKDYPNLRYGDPGDYGVSI